MFSLWFDLADVFGGLVEERYIASHTVLQWNWQFKLIRWIKLFYTNKFINMNVS